MLFNRRTSRSHVVKLQNIDEISLKYLHRRTIKQNKTIYKKYIAQSKNI